MSHLVFVLQGYNPCKQGCGFLSPYHRTGVTNPSSSIETSSSELVVTLDEPVLKTDALLWHTLRIAKKRDEDDAAVDVYVKLRDVIGLYPYSTHSLSKTLSEAYKTLPPTALPLKYAVGAQLSVRAFPNEHNSTATVVALHHSVPNLPGSWYEVTCTDMRWKNTPSPFIQGCVSGNYLIPRFVIQFGCNPVPDTNGKMPSMRTRLREGGQYGWRDLKFFKVGNVLKRNVSTHADGNETFNFSGYFHLKATCNDQDNSISLQPRFEAYTGDSEATLRPALDTTTLAMDTYKDNAHVLPLWRYYCGFTDAIEGNPIVDKSDDPAVEKMEPRGHYFDTRNYAEIDFVNGTLALQQRFLRQGYPIPEPGDWVCGLVGTNRVGSCLSLWFVCSEQLKQLIEYVQQPTAVAPAIALLRTNRYLDALQTQLSTCTSAEQRQAWADAFNTAMVAVRTETTSRPINRDVYQTVLALLVKDEDDADEAMRQYVDAEIHDIDPFRILVYHFWWRRHRRPQRNAPIKPRLVRFVTLPPSPSPSG